MHFRRKGVPTLLILGCLSSTSFGQQAPASLSINAAGAVSIKDETIPLSALLSDDGKRVLMRTSATEGPGAPVPTPTSITDMAEIRRVYNENLKPNVDHMRQVFPVDIEETTIDGISVAVITPKRGVPAKNAHRLVLNGPGGGFRTGVRGNGLLISIPVAAELGVKVVTITYRQGPEYQFPAASEDLLKVWDHFTKTYQPKNIAMVGCSAGGSLITQTTAMLIKAGRPTPGALGAFCSGLGAGDGGDSQYFAAAAVTNVRAAQAQAAAAPAPPLASNPDAPRNYYTGVDMNQFIVKPLIDPALLAKFPPTIFFTATRDFAMSHAAYSYRKLLEAGVDTQILLFDGLYHGFMTNPDFPESREGYRAVASFLDRHLGK